MAILMHDQQEDEPCPVVRTIPELLELQRDRHPNVPAIVTWDDSITFAELEEATTTAAGLLIQQGTVAGSRVGLLAPNSTTWAVLALAATRIGAVIVPLSTLLRPPELLAQLNIAAVSELIIVDTFLGRRYLDELDSMAPGLLNRLQGGQRHGNVPSLRRVLPLQAFHDPVTANPVVHEMEAQVTAADDLAVLFTSGSRGVPKGVIHTHGGALRAISSALQVRGLRSGDRLYLPMPFFWTGGFSQGLLSALFAGATLLTEAEPEPERTLLLLERERVTLFRGWHDQATRLAAHPNFAQTDLSSLRDGSLPSLLPPNRRPTTGARANLFGMTEMFGPYCGYPLDVDMPPEKHGSCGRPFDHVEVRIVDPASGVDLSSSQQGEIWLRSPNMFRGICRRERSTVLTRDGFYPTGDMGRLDEDGFLWFDGRLDDMIKVKGATVFPSEVEEALETLEQVPAAYVTDVLDQEGHAQVAAFVVTNATPSAVVASLRSRLSAFKVPTRWVFADSDSRIPRLASGKVDTHALQRLLQNEATLLKP